MNKVGVAKVGERQQRGNTGYEKWKVQVLVKLSQTIEVGLSIERFSKIQGCLWCIPPSGSTLFLRSALPFAR